MVFLIAGPPVEVGVTMYVLSISSVSEVLMVQFAFSNSYRTHIDSRSFIFFLPTFPRTDGSSLSHFFFHNVSCKSPAELFLYDSPALFLSPSFPFIPLLPFSYRISLPRYISISLLLYFPISLSLYLFISLSIYLPP